MDDLAIAVALVLVIEGVIYALFPEFMKRMMAHMMEQPASALRLAGLVSAAIGVALVWMIKHWAS